MIWLEGLLPNFSFSTSDLLACLTCWRNTFFTFENVKNSCSNVDFSNWKLAFNKLKIEIRKWKSES